ncbi:MAG: hypothetical protein Fur0016_15470 [Anaerolineales bacterium]
MNAPDFYFPFDSGQESNHGQPKVDKGPRQGWREQFKTMSEAGDDRLLDEPTPTQFDEDEWD